MADASPVSGDDLKRAEEFAREAFVLDGEDPGAARRFWFEHATGAGKTVAALGFVEASRTGGILILTHRRNLLLGLLRRVPVERLLVGQLIALELDLA